jgi:transcriptional regulator with XRE-family HTH domain
VELKGLTLRAIRINKGLKQDEAAKLIGISPDTLGNYERGKFFPDVPVIKAMERVYGVSYDQIIFFDQ